jgi:predicted nucleic acid-binding protein
MIVVDTNVIAYLLMPGKETASAEKLLKKDSIWLTPRLWRSEFRNVLVQYLRLSYLTLSQALQIMLKAEQLMKGREYEVNSAQVLENSFNSSCSAYDSEFITLARELGLPLITTDKKILKYFPNEALSIKEFINRK